LQLWDSGIDWNKISSYDLFMMLVKNVKMDTSRILFGDINFADFEPYIKTKIETNEDGEEVHISIPTLYNKNADIELSEEDYSTISDYLRTMFNIFPKVERVKGKNTKESIIDEERINLANRLK